MILLSHRKTLPLFYLENNINKNFYIFIHALRKPQIYAHLNFNVYLCWQILRICLTCIQFAHSSYRLLGQKVEPRIVSRLTAVMVREAVAWIAKQPYCPSIAGTQPRVAWAGWRSGLTLLEKLSTQCALWLFLAGGSCAHY